MNLKMCKVKDSCRPLSRKLNIIEEYDKRDLYVSLSLLSYGIKYNLGIAKVTDENLRKFLMNYLSFVLSSSLNILNFSIFNDFACFPSPPSFKNPSFEFVSEELLENKLREHYSSKLKGTMLCNIEDENRISASFQLDIYLNTTYVVLDGDSRNINKEDIVFMCKNLLISKNFIMQAIKGIREMREKSPEYDAHKIRLYYDIPREFNILDYFISFIEEECKNEFIFFKRYCKMQSAVRDFSLLSNESEHIEMNILAVSESLDKDIRYISEDQLKKIIDENKEFIFKEDEFMSYFFKRIVKENQELEELREIIEEEKHDSIKTALDIIISDLFCEIFSLYVYKIGLQDFINKHIFGDIKYELEVNSKEKFSTVLLRCGRSFKIEDLKKSKNFAAKLLFELIRKVILESTRYKEKIIIEGKKIRIIVGESKYFNYHYISFYYKNHNIFKIHFSCQDAYGYRGCFMEKVKKVEFHGDKVIFHPRGLELLFKDKEFKEDVDNLLRRFDIDSITTLDFMLKIIKAQLL